MVRPVYTEDYSFGSWVRRRRKSLDLTQEELAQRVGCAPITIRKLEGDEMRPSKQLAESLKKEINGLSSWMVGKADRIKQS